MSNRVYVRDVVRKIANIILWMCIIIPMIVFAYLYIKQFFILYPRGFGFIATVFDTWIDCSRMLLKLLAISCVFIFIKILTLMPKLFNRFNLYKQGVKVHDICVADSVEEFHSITSEKFFEKYSESMYDPVKVAALLPIALYNFVCNPNEGNKMLAVLMNIDENDTEFEVISKGISKQIADKKYIPLSYFNGAVPENGYTLKYVLTVKIKTGDSPDESRYEKTLYIACGGSGSYRPITVKCVSKRAIKKSSNKYMCTLKPDDRTWIIGDFPSILINVKSPIN